ncbi:hypothetical protein [Pyruvatibacter mobilis]|uniref:hypothetical protein n=1 Tax=Pyruvatibacter mobilis TaxID=1712261 RepID=UPI003BAA6F36
MWFSGSPAAFQSNFIETQSGDTIRHRGVPVVGKCYFPGDDIVVRVSCADFGGKVWLTEIIQNIKPGIALGTTHNSGTVYHNGPTSWSTTNRTAESLGTYFAAPIANNTAIQVPVTGLYSLAGHVYYSAAAGGGVSGSAFAIFGHNSVLQQAWAAAHRYFVVNEDTGYLDITTTRALKQGDLVQLYHQASSASLYFRPGKNYLRVELVSL